MCLGGQGAARGWRCGDASVVCDWQLPAWNDSPGKGQPCSWGSAQTLPRCRRAACSRADAKMEQIPPPPVWLPPVLDPYPCDPDTPTAPGPRSQGCSPLSKALIPASSQLPQTREPSSLCLLLLPLPRSGGRAKLGLSVPETSTGRWEWLVLLPARLPAREALALSPEPGTLGTEPRPAWGRRRCWCCSGPLGSLQRGCFPSKQHCSTHTRRDLQCREKPPTRHAAACGQGVELGAAVLPRPGLHAPAPAPCHVLGHSCLWHPHLPRWDHGDPLSTVPQGQSSAWHHGGDALLPTGLGLLPPSNAGFPQPTEQGEGGWHGWHGWHQLAGFLRVLGMQSTLGRQCRCRTGRVWAL